MRRFSIFIISFFLYFSLQGQNATIEITNNPLPDPLEFCIGETVDMQVIDIDSDNYESVNTWYTSTEEPDLVNWSNYSEWELVGNYTETQSIIIESEVYVFANISDLNMGYMTPYLHIFSKGTPPELVYNLTDTTFCEGNTVNISADPNNLGDGNYKWYKDGVEITGESSFEYSFTMPGIYSVSAMDASSECPTVFISSEAVEFNLIQPEIYGNLQIDLNRVALSTDDIYDTYQWYSGADMNSLTAITGSTSFQYNANITSADTYYSIEVTNAGGCVVMTDTVLVNDILYSVPVVVDPTSTFACEDGSVLLEVENDAYATYQWYRNGGSIWGATGPSITVNSAYNYGSGNYYVIVTTVLDEVDELESNSFDIEIATRPTISVLNNAVFCQDADVTLFTEDIFDSYQWYVNDINDFASAVALSGQTAETLSVTVLGENRYYFVESIYNSCTSVSSSSTVTPFALNNPSVYTSSYLSSTEICLGEEVDLRANSYQNVTFQWYLDNNVLTSVTDQYPTVSEVGAYQVEITSVDCPNLPALMSTGSVIIDYRVKPSYMQFPLGEIYNNEPNHFIYCQGEEVTLTADNASNYNSFQWQGKLYNPSSSTDEWTDIVGETNASYVSINGTVPFMNFRVSVDSLLADGSSCLGFSEHKVIDTWAFVGPVVASVNNAELCESGDESFLELAFTGSWVTYEWYDGYDLIPGETGPTYTATEEGDYTIMCYPAECPNQALSSGTPVSVRYMPDAMILEEISSNVIYATPLPITGYYYYQWYYSATNSDGDISNMQMIEDTTTPAYGFDFDYMDPGYYVVEITNPGACVRISEVYAYNVTGINALTKSNVNIYPNPVVDNLQITLDDVQNVEKIVIYNVLGKMLFEESNIIQNMNINMSSFERGTYILKTEFKDHTTKAYKVIKN